MYTMQMYAPVTLLAHLSSKLQENKDRKCITLGVKSKVVSFQTFSSDFARVLPPFVSHINDVTLFSSSMSGDQTKPPKTILRQPTSGIAKT